MPDDSGPTAISPVGHAPTESSAKPKRIQPGTRPFVALFLLLLFLGGSSFAGYKLFFQTKDGTLIVEVADQETETRFKKGELQILDAAGFVKYRLRPTEKRTEVAPGDYQVRVLGADGLELDTQVFAMKKGGKVVVRVTARPPASAAKKNPALPDGVEWALEFDGRSSYVDLPLGYDGSHPLTIEAAVTVDPNGLDITGLVTNLAMPSRGKGGASLHLLPRGHGWQFIRHRQGKEVRAAGGPAIQPGRRTRLAGVWDGKTCRLFVDGKLVALSDATHEMNSIDNPARFVLGCERLEGGTGWHYRGLIDEVRISRVARFDRDYTPAPRLDADNHTLALYRFEEGRGETLIDSSGKKQHGRIVGAKWVKLKGM